jgi:hypothetical protein
LFEKKQQKTFAPWSQSMDAVAEIIRDLLIFVAVMFGLTVGLIILVSQLPDRNPLKRIFTALAWRVGATFGAGLVAIPIEPIPGLDIAYDIGVPIALIWFWYTFVRDIARRPPGGPIIDHDPR